MSLCSGFSNRSITSQHGNMANEAAISSPIPTGLVLPVMSNQLHNHTALRPRSIPRPQIPRSKPHPLPNPQWISRIPIPRHPHFRRRIRRFIKNQLKSVFPRIRKTLGVFCADWRWKNTLLQMNRECLCLEGFFHEGVFRGDFALVTDVEDYDWAFCDCYFNVEVN